MPEKTQDGELATVVPLPSANSEATLGMLVASISTLTAAVKENSEEVKESNKKIDNLSTQLGGVKQAFAVHQTEMIADAQRQDTVSSAIETRVKGLERRQDADEELRSTSLKDELSALKDRLKSDEEHKNAADKKDVAYFRSRRNYWIGIAVTFILGLAGTYIASEMKDNAPKDPPKKEAPADTKPKPKFNPRRGR